MPENPVPKDKITATKPPTLNGPPTPAPSTKTKGKGKSDHPRDSVREVFETVVFVVVLVLMLKTFVAEAFVIPTGSMAETLYGYQRMVVCDQCGYKFPVGCSSEVDPQRGNARQEITGCFCPNCQNAIAWKYSDEVPDPRQREQIHQLNEREHRTLEKPAWSSGDRVLVAKFLYDRDMLWSPQRHQIIVFKYPREPQQATTAINYIKRCEGLPGETIVIFDGDLYVTRGLTYPNHDLPKDPLNLWEREYMYVGDQAAIDLFVASMERRAAGKPQAGDFELIRKPPEVMLAMRRIVFNNDSQPKDLAGLGIHRWQLPKAGRWAGNDPTLPTTFAHTPKAGDEPFEWMTYAHLLGVRERFDAAQAGARKDMLERFKLLPTELHNARDISYQDDRRLISNMMGYNTDERPQNPEQAGHYWVSDLMLDLEVKIDSPQGEFVLELSKGIDRFRAVFNVANGECSLVRMTGRTEEEREKNQRVLDKKESKLKGKGSYHVRFANFDERLTVWVDGRLPFGDGVVYPTASERGPIAQNDLEAPARVGARGAAASVTHLSLWHDTFYTLMEETGQIPKTATILNKERSLLSMYVQPGHYLALGDNSASSADSRDWGLVPERLLLGRALVVYFPFWPLGNQRAGLIR